MSIYGLESIKAKTKVLIVTMDQASCDALIEKDYAAVYLNGADPDDLPKINTILVWPGTTDIQKAQNIADKIPAKMMPTLLTAHELIAQGAPRKEINDMIKEAVETREDIEKYLMPMGYDSNNHYYFKKESKLLVALSTSGHTKNNYLAMAPMFAWQHWVGNRKKLTTEDWDYITDRLMRKCESKGYFTPEKIRGRGTWFDDNRTVVHLGNRLLVDGKEHRLGSIETNYVYQIGDSLPSLNTSPAQKEESEYLLDVCRHLKWQNPCMGVLLAGFIALVPIAGTLPWRPHIYITGSKQSGKTTVMNYIIRHVLGAWGIRPEAGTTEPGIRNRLQHDALAVIYDEAGIENERDRMRMEAIFKLARSASSSDGEIMKGSADGKGMSFTVKGMFAFASVNPNIENDQDQSRIAMLTLRSTEKGDKGAQLHYDQLLSMLAKLTDDFCARLHARTIANVKTTLENIRIFRQVCQREYGDVRKADQFGTLFAGAYSLTSDQIIDPIDAQLWIERYSIEPSIVGIGTIDEDKCWDTLMQHQLQITPSNKMPIGEAIRGNMDIDEDADYRHAHKLLINIGIKLDIENKLVFIAPESLEIRRIFKDTPWRDYIPILIKLFTYQPNFNKSHRVCGSVKRCYAFKWE